MKSLEITESLSRYLEQRDKLKWQFKGNEIGGE